MAGDDGGGGSEWSFSRESDREKRTGKRVWVGVK